MKGDIETLEIKKVVSGGEGLGHTGGHVLFVPYTLPGETVAVEITQERKNYRRGRIQALLIPSAERRAPPCPVFTTCGGCQLQHLPEGRQLHYKVEALRETLFPLGDLASLPLLPPIPSPEAFHYRTRATLKIHDGQVGFYQPESHTLVPIDACPLLIPELNQTMAWLARNAPLHQLTEIELQGNGRGEVIVIITGHFFSSKTAFYKRAQEALLEGSSPVSLKGMIFYIRQHRLTLGQAHLVVSAHGQNLKISDRAFSQINLPCAALVIEKVIEWLVPEPSDVLLELYSGVGTFTVPLASRVREITAIEGNPYAVADARKNTLRMKNVRLVDASVEMGLAATPSGYASKLFLNPPREGVSGEVLTHLIRLAPPQIVYLSCDPATLTRDLKRLVTAGYQVTRLQPFDMFPQTSHLEVMAELTLAAPIV